MPPRYPVLHLCSMLLVFLGTCLPDTLALRAVLDTMPNQSSYDELGPGTPSSDGARSTFDRAEALRRLDERDEAIGVLQPLLDHPDPNVAAEARYQIALLRLEMGSAQAAAGGLEELLDRFPTVPLVDRAAFLLGLARARTDDCAGAAAAFARYQERGTLLAPYASLQLTACAQRSGDAGAALARSDEVLQQANVRLTRIDALERQEDVLERSGDLAGALARLRQLVDLARAPEYRASVRLSAARLALQLGRDEEAVADLVAAVNDAPATRGAATALDRLVELGAVDHVSYYQAGLVRFFSGSYAAAQRNFEGALATPSEATSHPAAAYYRAVALVRQGAELEGAQELLALPGSYPASPFAPDALLRGGKVLESNGRLNAAATAYQRVADDYPASVQAGEALFRLGLVRLLTGAPAQAASAWGRLGAADGPADLRALGLFWQGKAEAQDGELAAARDRWQRAADLAPGRYEGLRAGDLLTGNADGLATGGTIDTSRLAPTADELAELDAWMATRGAKLADLATELAAEPAWQRADALLAVGLNAEAGWEIDELSTRYAADPARLAALALALHERGLETTALRQAQLALDAAHLVASDAPAALRKLLYPLPFADLVADAAARYGVDPLLFAALIWQESKFDPHARSAANAIGLTQVVPPTGRGIARALGRLDFKDEDLLHPAVSLEFGAYYFGERLRRYGGAVLPALAAYNAGDGSVDRWTADFGRSDLDLFAERIPYAETNHYVKIIYETYGAYRALYGAR